MLYLEFKGEISTPMIDAKDSNIDPNIEIIKVFLSSKSSDYKFVRLLRNPESYKRQINLEDIYEERIDFNGINFLKRLELYPELPEDVFIPINVVNIIDNTYYVNKLGEVISFYRGAINKNRYMIVTGGVSKGYNSMGLVSVNGVRKNIRRHRLVASTFLFNVDYTIYNSVNHISSDHFDNKLSNLEWVTIAGNNSSDKKKHATVLKSRVDSVNKLIGYSGNLGDYEWLQHPIYPGLFVCKEGFISNGIKRIGHLMGDGYIRIKYTYIKNGKKIKIQRAAQRIIIEYLYNRRLKEDEVVDHINTLKYDNSFCNLKLTDSKGNMSNSVTIEKHSKKLILTDLYGDFVMYGITKNINKKIFDNKDDFKSYTELINCIIINSKYFCIQCEDRDSLIKKMEKIIYVFNSDRTKVLGAFSNLSSAGDYFNVSPTTISKRVLSNKKASDNNYYMRGPEAVKLVVSLGHGTATNFKLEDTK